MRGEHFSPEYKKINPTSTVPALMDGDTNVFDSNAIAIYMVEKYAKDDSLYPKDFKLQTKVNERLFYIASYIFPRGYQLFFNVFLGKRAAAEVSENELMEFHRGFETVESFLDGNEYLTGNTLTLADLSLWCMTESGSQLIPIVETKYPNYSRWLAKMRELPTFELNKEGADKHVAFYHQCLARNIAQSAQK